jgi:hypothetical protein
MQQKTLRKLQKTYVNRSGEAKELDVAWFQHAEIVVPRGMKRAAEKARRVFFDPKNIAEWEKGYGK